MTRNWQESFDKLEQSRREEQRMREAEERQMRLAEAAYERASLEVASAEKAAGVGSGDFMLADDGGERVTAQAEALVETKPGAKPRSGKPGTAKPKAAKPGARKRAAPRRTAKVARPRTAKPTIAKTGTAKSGTAGPKAIRAKVAMPVAPELATAPPITIPSQPAISLPPETSPTAAEPLLITPLPRSASLARFNKQGLFGLIGSWLRLAARRPRLPESLRRPARKDRAPRDDLAALQEENRQLRQELEALRAGQANNPPWATNPETTLAGDVPVRPRRRGGTRP